MKKSLLLAATFAALVAAPASAALVGDFRLDGNTTNLAGGPLTLTNNGGTLGATGITFAPNQGPTVNGFSSPSAYTVQLGFSLTNTSGYRKILDFMNRSSDTGFYVLSNQLNFYPVVTGGTVFAPNTVANVVLTHDGATTAGYVNGVQQWTFGGGSNSLASISSVLHILRDDFATGQGEASGGFLDYVQIYDTALSAAEVSDLTPPGPIGAVPEPASWALMIAGFGLVGGAMRRRSSLKVTYA